MRYLCYTLGDPSVEIAPPTPQLMADMDVFMQEATQAGVILAAGGVGPLDTATRVNSEAGEITVLDGPFTEAKELIGGWALMECRDQDEAVEWSRRFLAIAGDGQVTVRPVF